MLVVAVSAYVIVWQPGLVDQLIHPPHAPDNELIANFHRHRADFEKLREMILQDKDLLRVTSNLTQPEDLRSIGISSVRIAEYRKLLKVLGIEGGVTASSDRANVEFTTSFRGFVTHGSQKGYLYSTNPVTEPLAGLDQFSATGVGIGLRHIEGNWYLFFEGY